jgi:4-alpha-glucanotransferase
MRSAARRGINGNVPCSNATAGALAAARESLREQIEAQKFYQFLFFKQWGALKRYCNERGISVVGDIPIFVAHDSADVWTHPHLFKLNEDGSPRVVAGVPPDYFSATGQLWGNPLYDWEQMKAEDFRWWIRRISSMLREVDILRIDHFRGFAASWEIPGGDLTAGARALGQRAGQGTLHRDQKSPRRCADLRRRPRRHHARRGAPARRFQFPRHAHPSVRFRRRQQEHRFTAQLSSQRRRLYGTHDNDTTVGWFKSEAGDGGSTRKVEQIERERKFCLDYLNSQGKEIHWDFIRAALASVANTAIIPLQDVLGLGNEARMNLPNSTSGNWNWRYAAGALTDEVRDRLKELTGTLRTQPESGSQRPEIG